MTITCIVRRARRAAPRAMSDVGLVLVLGLAVVFVPIATLNVVANATDLRGAAAPASDAYGRPASGPPAAGGPR